MSAERQAVLASLVGQTGLGVLYGLLSRSAERTPRQLERLLRNLVLVEAERKPHFIYAPAPGKAGYHLIERKLMARTYPEIAHEFGHQITLGRLGRYLPATLYTAGLFAPLAVGIYAGIKDKQLLPVALAAGIPIVGMEAAATIAGLRALRQLSRVHPQLIKSLKISPRTAALHLGVALATYAAASPIFYGIGKYLIQGIKNLRRFFAQSADNSS